MDLSTQYGPSTEHPWQDVESFRYHPYLCHNIAWQQSLDSYFLPRSKRFLSNHNTADSKNSNKLVDNSLPVLLCPKRTAIQNGYFVYDPTIILVATSEMVSRPNSNDCLAINPAYLHNQARHSLSKTDKILISKRLIKGEHITIYVNVNNKIQGIVTYANGKIEPADFVKDFLPSLDYTNNKKIAIARATLHNHCHFLVSGGNIYVKLNIVGGFSLGRFMGFVG